MARYAVINGNGTINWSRDPDLMSVTPTSTGNYILNFRNRCDEDVFVAHAIPPGPGCDGPRVVLTSLQNGRDKICVAVSNVSNPADYVDSRFSYIRYPKADEFRASGDGGDERCYPCNADTKSRDWYAWMDLMPPAPFDLHVVGEIEVANPGVTPLLVPKSPQGINPRILLLDLYLCQAPGNWPSVVVWKQARYDKVLVGDQRYDQVQVFCGETVIADLKVEEVH